MLTVTLICGLGLSDFYTRGEAREALIVQAMVSQGEYVLPRGYNGLVPSKPPLFHWLGAAVSHIAGRVNEFTVRLPSALASLGTLIFFLVALRRHLTPRMSFCFILLLMFSFEWLRAGISARVDMVHAAALSCGLLSAFVAFEGGGRRYWIAMTTFLALAILSKGPVGVALPALILPIWIFVRPKSAEKIPLIINTAAGLALALTIALTWYGAAYIEAPSEFIHKVWYENVARFTSTMHDKPHDHSIFYLLGVLFLGTLPWSPGVCWLAFRHRPRSVTAFKEWWHAAPSFQKFSLIAAIAIILFYSVPSSKRGVYLLAAYPFLAYLSAVLLAAQTQLSDTLLHKTFRTAVGAILIAQVVIVPYFVAPRSSERKIAKTLLGITSAEPIYSFGFDFYGASFYAKKKFLILEDYLRAPPADIPASIPVVFFASQVHELENATAEKRFVLHVDADIPLKSDTVKIAQISLFTRKD